MPQNAPSSSDAVSSVDPQLNDRQYAAIEAILQGSSVTDAAQKVGIDRKTLYRWRTNDAAFATELRERRTEAVQHCVDRLCNLLGTALDILERQLKQTYAPTSHRAARTLLSLAGIGKSAAAQTIAPPTAKPQAALKTAANPSGATQPVATKPGLSPSTAAALARAVNAVDLLGLRNESSSAG